MMVRTEICDKSRTLEKNSKELSSQVAFTQININIQDTWNELLIYVYQRPDHFKIGKNMIV